jgi:subtilisin-like proprotein convertase family protein
MRLRPAIWILVCALILAGAWLSFNLRFAIRDLRFGKNRPAAALNLQPSTFNLQPSGSVAASAVTNQFPYRVGNTTKSIGALMDDPRAILLENALIDTRLPLNLAIPKNLRAQGSPGAWIVQARGPIDSAFRAMLAREGAQVVSYIPNNAYLVTAPAGVAGDIAASGFSVLPYEPYYKVQSPLLAFGQKQLPAGAELNLGLFAGDAPATVRQIESLGGTVLATDSSPFGPVVRVQAPENWTALAQLPGVQIVEPYHPRVHANDLSRPTLGVSVDSITTTNYMNLSGSGVIVEVNDSGVDASHPDLAGRVSGVTTNDTIDTDGHGTFVAGQIAGSGSESATVTNAEGSINPGTNGQYRGKAPLAKLLAMNLNDSDQDLQQTAALSNAPISNNSWIYDSDNTYDLAAASYDAATRDALPGTTGSQPVLFVFSAGNNGDGEDDGVNGNPDTIQSPATAKDVITAGAVEQLRNITNVVTTISGGTTNTSTPWAGMTDTGYSPIYNSVSPQVAGYSSRGNVGVGIEGVTGRFKPDVVAPGTFVISTRSTKWDEAAYFYVNPTNDDQERYTNIVLQPGDTWDNSFPPVSSNALQVTIQVVPNDDSPSQLNLPIYVGLETSPGWDPGFPTTNAVSIPPDGGAGYLQQIFSTEDIGGAFGYSISNSTAEPISFDVITGIITTNNNDAANENLVLSNLDGSIGPYYRYETGTSMAAADISGLLALMQDFFINHTTQTNPSPALLKALLINGAATVGNYNFNQTDGRNYQGWGLANLPDSLPAGITNQPGVPCGSFFVDQSPANALVTGDSHTFLVSVASNSLPQSLRVTLAWTDPPGNPVAAIKLVNDLTLVVTNLDGTNPVVYFGNDIPAGAIHNEGWSASLLTNTLPVDSINNIENVFLPAGAGANFSVTVIGNRVNVNAVTAQTNNVAQDYALVISCGADAITVTDSGIVSNPTGDQDITIVVTNNVPLLNQFAGASSPLLGTNTVGAGTNNGFAANATLTIGQTNQWHFYVVTNSTNFANAAFVTFSPDTLAIPRMGVLADSDADSTRPEADVDVFVSSDPTLTNLNPAVISNCVNGAQIAASSAGPTFNGASLGRGGTEFVVDTNSAQGQVYYVGVQSEDREGSEYDFLPVFSRQPFSQTGTNGDETVNGVPLPMDIPDGSPQNPGSAYVLAIALDQMVVQDVIVTDELMHQNIGDLTGVLSFDGTSVVLNNHVSIQSPAPPGPYTFVYDDSQNPVPGSQSSDGPGSLNSFTGQQALGVWILTETDSSLTQTGSIQNFSMLIQPHQDPSKGGITVTIQPKSWYYTYVDVPLGYTNFSVFATNLPPTSQPLPLQLYLNVGVEPTSADYLLEADLINCITGVYPTGIDPGNSISYGPPLQPGTYWIGIYNPDSVAHNAYLIASLNGQSETPHQTDQDSYGGIITDDAVTTNTISVSATNGIESVNVGMVVKAPRISDYTFTLVSPTGQRVLLMENRGGYDTNGAGSEFIYTNVINSTATGGAAADTNYLAVPITGITVPITYNFYTVPDEMTVYDGTNISPGNLIFDTGFTNNPPIGPGSENTQPETIYVTVQPGFTNITIIMNEFGNPYSAGGDAWIYTAGAQITNFQYLVFTEDTNLTTTPIKFALPPFSFTPMATNYVLSDFEKATNGDYLAPTNIYDAFGGWSMPTNEWIGTNLVLWTNNLVSVVSDPATSLGDNVGSNYLTLADGSITRSIPTTPNSLYNITFWYRGPGISGWWRGEGNATDSSDPENNGNNGSLIGQFDFPAGEVGQAFQFENPGNPYEFAGTNAYVQIRQSASLDVGTGGGFTVEGWINPTNTSFQQPLVEWLAKIPVVTNSPDTNFNIVAGPFLDRATQHYYYLLGATNWTTSEQWAQSLGGHLATVDTANEENWIYDTFAGYAGTNLGALWIGLNDTNTPFKFVYSSGLTNVTYANWATGQPLNCNGNEFYTAIITATNALSGLWVLAANNGVSCTTPAANIAYGVVEVNNIQTNGVQFWISVTNTPGTTNALVSSSGCLYADLVDVSNVTHEIYSAPGLIQSNIFQHVALTYSTNSGIANLYYDGTNVASTNFGGIRFVPKTGGDVLLGRDMSLQTNNFYNGEMDEMSIYSRALSHAEIQAICQVSAFSTNRNTGKFDPTVTPAEGLAEAQVVFGGNTNVIYGQNNQWEVNSYTFTATSNTMPLQINGLEPGMLLDQFDVSETPLGNLYYLPEQSLASLDGTPANGTGISGQSGAWTLEIWDNRANALATNADLVNWQLQFVLQTNVLAVPLPVGPEEPATITVPPGQTVYLSVPVPTWANYATNILVSATAPVNLFFNQTTTPTGNVPPDTELLTGSTGGIGLPVLSANPPSTPPLLPGQTYYLGVSNPGAHAVTAVVEVDFDITTLTNNLPLTSVLNTNDSVRYFAFNVSSNACEATFQLLDLSGNADMVVRRGSPLPTLFSDDYGSFNATNADENIYVLTNSSPVPLSAGVWYLGVLKRDAGAVNYTVLAKELDVTNGAGGCTVIDLTNGVPVNFTAGPGAALTNFFRFSVANNPALTNAPGLRFELYNLSGNGDLTVQTDAPPFAPPFFQSSQEPGTVPELIYIRTNSALTNLAADWYLGVPDNETVPIHFTIEAVIDTNAYFPAFPGATGSGGGAVGAGHAGTPGTVYHVTSTADSGPSTLRAAVSASNRTVVFDVSGVIGLLSTLTITNSYLTIAGQTAPGGGITVAGQMTVVTNAHDVIIRDVQFCTGVGGAENNGFEGQTAQDYTSGQTVAGWTVLTNQVSVVTDPTNACVGSNFLALASGVISNTLPTAAGNIYTLTFAYRGPGIVSLWRGESNANDSIGGNNGYLSNDVSYATGEVNSAFDMGTNGFVFIPASTSLNVGTDPGFTVDGWIYPRDVSNDPKPIFEWSQYGNSSEVNFYLSYASPPGCLFSDILDTNMVDHTFWTVSNVVAPNIFQHVALTYNRLTGNAFIYYNGSMMANANLGSYVPWTSGPLLLGGRINNGYAPQNFRFNGKMDEMSLYGRALSTSEIKAIWQKGGAGKFDSNAPSVVQGLAEAKISVNGQTPVTILGSNTNWQTYTVTFTATQNGTPMEITGLEPGMLLDSFSALATNVVNPGDPLQFNTVSNVIADHVSALWSTNEDLSVLTSTNVTVQWSVLADSLYAATNFPGYGSRLRYGSGALSFNHNLYADNNNASPRLGDNLSLDFVNNVIYDWGTNAGFSTNDIADDPSGFTNELNYVCNYLIAGTNSSMKNIAFWGGSTNTWIFQTNNFMDSDTNGILDGANTGWNMFTNLFAKFSQPFPLIPVPTDEAFLAYEKVLDFAGPDMDKRDSADSNIVERVRTQTGALISSASAPPARNSSLPYLDTDQDGIPDFWETTFGTDPFTPNPYSAIDGSGYTELEEYDNWLAGPHALTVTNTPVGVNLQQLFGNTGNLSFSVTNGVNGAVYLTNVWGSVTNTGAYSNSFAVFTPTNNFSGYASFDAFVTNNDTVAYFGPVTVSVVVSKVPVKINSNMPPVIVTLSTGVLDPTNYGGSDFYKFTVTTNFFGSNAVAVLFTVTNASGPVDLLANYGLPLPSLSSYNYISTNSWTTSENILVTPNSTPVALTNGDWYLAVVNVAGSNVTYDIEATTLYNISPPLFLSPTNGEFFTNIEMTLFTVTSQATDPNTPTLPLTYAIVTNVPGVNLLNVTDTNVMTINPNTGVITWTPDEAQGPSTNLISVSVANGIFSVTNSFTIVVEESNLPPVFVLTNIPNQIVIAPNTLVVTNTATDPDIPANPLTYTLTSTVPGTNAPVIDTNGVIIWMSTLADIDSNYLFTTVVTDTNQWAVNSKSLSATNSFIVTVLPALIGGQPQSNAVPAGGINWFAVSVPTNATAATNLLLFATNLPVNVWFSTNVPPSITSTNDFDLLPAATNGASVLTTNSSPTNIVPGGVYFLGVQNTNGVAVNYAIEVNFELLATNTLKLPKQTNYIARVGMQLVVTNTATDSDTNLTLTYTLTNWPAALTTAMINSNGIITWTPGAPDAGGSFKLTTTVADNGLPPLSATNAFTVFVLPAPAISNVVVTATNVTLRWTAPTNDLFRVQSATNLAPVVIWTTFPQVITPTAGLFMFTDTNPPVPMKFYRLLWLPLP